MMSELISKNKAITALIFSEETKDIKCEDMKKVLDVLKMLPSAEPKIIHCKNCKNRGEDECPMRHVERVEWEEDGYIEVDDIVHDYTEPYGYCDKGERNE